jgi:hypothetical protein
MENDAANLESVLGTKALKPFRPLAYYDRHMDCIRIELRDCSITEKRIDEKITVLLDNFPDQNQSPIAGLMIKGVKHYLFKELGLPVEGILFVTSILDKLTKLYPDEIEANIRKLVYEIDLTVNLDEKEELQEELAA